MNRKSVDCSAKKKVPQKKSSYRYDRHNTHTCTFHRFGYIYKQHMRSTYVHVLTLHIVGGLVSTCLLGDKAPTWIWIQNTECAYWITGIQCPTIFELNACEHRMCSPIVQKNRVKKIYIFDYNYLNSLLLFQIKF